MLTWRMSCAPLATLIANNELALLRPEQADIRECWRPTWRSCTA